MTARWAVRAATWPVRRQGESLLLRQKSGTTFRCGTTFVYSTNFAGIRTGAVLNDSPVGCQSRDLACPQTGRIPPSPPKKVVPRFDVVRFFCFILNRR